MQDLSASCISRSEGAVEMLEQSSDPVCPLSNIYDANAFWTSLLSSSLCVLHPESHRHAIWRRNQTSLTINVSIQDLLLQRQVLGTAFMKLSHRLISFAKGLHNRQWNSELYQLTCTPIVSLWVYSTGLMQPIDLLLAAEETHHLQSEEFVTEQRNRPVSICSDCFQNSPTGRTVW
jgi:hypothetical protein